MDEIVLQCDFCNFIKHIDKGEPDDLALLKNRNCPYCHPDKKAKLEEVQDTQQITESANKLFNNEKAFPIFDTGGESQTSVDEHASVTLETDIPSIRSTKNVPAVDAPFPKDDSKSATSSENGGLTFPIIAAIVENRGNIMDEHGNVTLQAVIASDRHVANARAWLQRRNGEAKGQHQDFGITGHDYKRNLELGIRLGKRRNVILQLVIECNEDPLRRWIGDFHIKAGTTNHPASITIINNKTINASDHAAVLEGINEQQNNLNQDLRDKETSTAISLERRPSKTFTELPWDDSNAARESNVTIDPHLLILSFQDEKNGQEKRIKLIGGTTCRVGRMLYEVENKDDEKKTENDLILRCKSGGFDETQISRHHGKFSINNDGLVYQNISASFGSAFRYGDSHVDDMPSKASPPQLVKSRSAKYFPASKMQTKTNRFYLTITLHVVGLKQQIIEHHAKLYESEFGDSKRVIVDTQTPMSVRLRRSDDVPESYIFFNRAIIVGRSEKCDVQIEHDSLKPRHAIIFFLGGRLWIAKYGKGCKVEIRTPSYSFVLRHDDVHLIEPHCELVLGKKEIDLLHASSQHLIDCNCCQEQ